MALFFIPFITGAFGGAVANKFTNSFANATLQASISGSHVVARCQVLPEFGFYKERTSVKFFLDYLGVFEEFSTGDKIFDKEVYISSDSPMIAKVLKSNPEARVLIQGLLSAKEVQKIEFHKGVIDVFVKGSKAKLKENLENVMLRYSDDIELLAKIFKKELQIQSSIMTDTNIRVQEDVSYNAKIKWIIVAYVSVLSGLICELLWGMTMHSNENLVIGSYSLRAMAMLSVVMFILFGALALYLASPSRKTHRVLYTHFTLGLVSCAIAGPILYNTANVILDTSPSVTYSVDYTTTKRRGSKSTSYYFNVQSVKLKGEEVSSTDYHKYDELSPGQRYNISGGRYRELSQKGNLELTVRSGFFRQPYIVEI